ncbi:MAG: hypothetical protein ACRDHG_03595 [Anaerolineales bacterium]
MQHRDADIRTRETRNPFEQMLGRRSRGVLDQQAAIDRNVNQIVNSPES